MKIRILTLILTTSMMGFGLQGCNSEDIERNEDFVPEEDNEVIDDWEDDNDAQFDPNPQEINVENGVLISFTDSGVNIQNQFDGVTVTDDNGHVTIKSERTDLELDYVLSGTTDDGSVKFYGDYKFNLHLNGVSITNPNGSAINNQCGKKTTVYMVDRTQNRLIDGPEYIMYGTENQKGTFFSEGQLVFEGEGELIVRGRYKHGICSDDYFRQNSGTITVMEAASDAVHANDYIRIDGGTLSTRSVGDGLDCEKGYVVINGGDIDISTTGQKGHGIKSKESVAINSGNISIKVFGKASKGINSTQDITIKGGIIDIGTAGDAYWDNDDQDISSAACIKGDAGITIDEGNLILRSTGSGGKGINVSGDFIMNDGTLQVTTSGDQFVYRTEDTAAKAVRAKGDLTVNGGTIKIKTSRTEAEGLESKAKLTINDGLIEVEAYDDCINAGTHIQINGGRIYCLSESNDGIDSNGTLTITGGTIVSIGTRSPEAGIDCDNSEFTITGGIIVGFGGDTSTPTERTCKQYSVVYRASSQATVYRITDQSGTTILTFQAPVSISGTSTLLFSSPEIEGNTTYTISTGGTINGGTEFNGLYSGATHSGGSTATTFTTSNKVNTAGSSGNSSIPGPGGRP